MREKFTINEFSWFKKGIKQTVGGSIIVHDYNLREKVFMTKSPSHKEYIEWLKNLPKPVPEPYKSVWDEIK